MRSHAEPCSNGGASPRICGWSRDRRCRLARVCKTAPEDRNAQFEHIAELREDFAARGLPIISVDAKKKELVGLFKNPGAAWSHEPLEVRDHDFLSEAVGKAVSLEPERGGHGVAHC